MTIDTARLATDAGYWDEVAPNWATHYKPESEESIASWWHVPDGCELPSEGLIPRPQSEWVDGLPPVGSEVEYSFGMFQCPDVPVKRAKYIGPDHDNLVIKFLGEHEGSRFTSTSPSCVRPIPTKAQRDRDELITILGGNWLSSDMDQLADAIIVAGWTKP